MKILKRMKDGGPESLVWGYFLIEAKSLFSIALLRFENGSREAFHSHAFNCFSWILKGRLEEEHLLMGLQGKRNWHKPSLSPFKTKKDTFHRVTSHGRTWVLTFRGPWAKEWQEYLPETKEVVTLTHGRNKV